MEAEGQCARADSVPVKWVRLRMCASRLDAPTWEYQGTLRSPSKISLAHSVTIEGQAGLTIPWPFICLPGPSTV